MDTSYRIVLHDDTGSFKSTAIAESVEGYVFSTVSRFDGVHDLAIVFIDSENADALEAMLEDDPNVESYGERA